MMQYCAVMPKHSDAVTQGCPQIRWDGEALKSPACLQILSAKHDGPFQMGDEEQKAGAVVQRPTEREGINLRGMDAWDFHSRHVPSCDTAEGPAATQAQIKK
eukprot:1158454-Pelagomonas_calceolata.AAC.6